MMWVKCAALAVEQRYVDDGRPRARCAGRILIDPLATVPVGNASAVFIDHKSLPGEV
jgi:hypothetical protein